MLAAVRGLSRPLGAAALAQRPRALMTSAAATTTTRTTTRTARTAKRAPLRTTKELKANTPPIATSLEMMQENLDQLRLTHKPDKQIDWLVSHDEMLQHFYRRWVRKEDFSKYEREILIKHFTPEASSLMDLEISTPVSTDPVVRKGLFAARKAQLAFSQQYMRRHRELEKNTSAYQLILLYMELEDFCNDQRTTFIREMHYLSDYVRKMKSPQARDLARAECRVAFRKISFMMTSTRFFQINGIGERQFLDTNRERALFHAYHTLLDDGYARLKAVKMSEEYHVGSISLRHYAESWWRPSTKSSKERCLHELVSVTLNDTLGVVFLQLGLDGTSFIDKLALVGLSALQDTFWRSSDGRRLIAPHAEPAVKAFVNANIPTQSRSIFARDPTMAPVVLHPGTYTWRPQKKLDKILGDPVIVVGHIMVRREDGTISNAPFRARKTDNDDEVLEICEPGSAPVYGSASDRRFLHCTISISPELAVENRTIFGDFLPGVPETELIEFGALINIEMDLPRDVEVNPDDTKNLDITAEPFNARVTGIYDYDHVADMVRDSHALLRSSLS